MTDPFLRGALRLYLVWTGRATGGAAVRRARASFLVVGGHFDTGRCQFADWCEVSWGQGRRVDGERHVALIPALRHVSEAA